MNKPLKFLLSILLASSASAYANDANCNLEQGKRIFNKCAACHSLDADKHMMGPSLHQLSGRKAGTMESFRFSRALQHSKLTWDKASLDKFLKSPMKFVPGTTMPFGGLRNNADRQALICFLLNQK